MIKAFRTLIALSKIEAECVFRSLPMALALMCFLSGALLWGSAQIEPLSYKIEDEMRGRAFSWPGHPIMIQAGSDPAAASSDFDDESSKDSRPPPQFSLKWIALADGALPVFGPKAQNAFLLGGGRLEELRGKDGELYFEEAGRQKKLPAAIIYPATSTEKAFAELRLPANATPNDERRAEGELFLLMETGALEAAPASRPRPTDLGFIEIDGLPTKAIVAEAAASPALPGARQRAVLGACTTLLALMSAGWAIGIARRRALVGAFEAHASSSAKTWVLALSQPMGSSLIFWAAASVGLALSTILFLGQIELRLAVQASLTLLIQAMSLACWEALTLSFALKTTLITRLIFLSPLFYVLHLLKLAIFDAAGGLNGAVSALMSDSLHTWAVAACCYAFSGFLAIVLAHFKIGSGQRKIWQAKR